VRSKSCASCVSASAAFDVPACTRAFARGLPLTASAKTFAVHVTGYPVSHLVPLLHRPPLQGSAAFPGEPEQADLRVVALMTQGRSQQRVIDMRVARAASRAVPITVCISRARDRTPPVSAVKKRRGRAPRRVPGRYALTPSASSARPPLNHPGESGDSSRATSKDTEQTEGPKVRIQGQRQISERLPSKWIIGIIQHG
jgi:hypothetical protein